MSEKIAQLPVPSFETNEGTRVRLSARNAKYSEELAVRICERIMMKETLKQITNDPRMPSMTTVIRWLADPRLAAFREMYYMARRVQAELLVDEIFEIADDASRDYKEVIGSDGEVRIEPNNEHIQRSRVRIDTRKWFASKLIPRIYGEKKQIDHEVVGDLAELMKQASNRDNGLPKPIS